MPVQFIPVLRKGDWKHVADFLMRRAIERPLSHKDSERYSKTEKEAWEKAERGMAAGKSDQMTSHSVAVSYKFGATYSLVLTQEPNHNLHLSMAEAKNGGLARMPDEIAFEAAQAILGLYEERKEGVMSGVRHFYQKAPTQ